MQPTIGRTVLYRLSEKDCVEINRRREHATNNMDHHRDSALGVQIHVGNRVSPGDYAPMILTRIGSSAVNGTVMLDGNDTFWARDIRHDDGSGTEDRPNLGVWLWPPLVD